MTFSKKAKRVATTLGKKALREGTRLGKKALRSGVDKLQEHLNDKPAASAVSSGESANSSDDS